MAPDQQDPRLGDILEASDGHLDYIRKISERGQSVT